MKKLKNHKALLTKAIAESVNHGENRGAVEFEAADSANEKTQYIYRLLVHGQGIQPIPEDQVFQKPMTHKQAIRASKLK